MEHLIRQILANIGANLRFFLRNRLLAAFLLVMLALLGLSLVPMLLFSTNSQKFNLITQTYALVDMVVYLLVHAADTEKRLVRY